ncbi:GNAT family N-acetyltransferase [Acidithiobacillus ferrivorans]
MRRDDSGVICRNPILSSFSAVWPVDQACQGKGWGRALVQAAALRILPAADVIGIRGVIVQAASGSAKAVYEKMGFGASPLDPMTPAGLILLGSVSLRKPTDMHYICHIPRASLGEYFNA